MSGVDSCQIHLKDDARRRASEALYPIPNMAPPKPCTRTSTLIWNLAI